jgi:hypothetical protein
MSEQVQTTEQGRGVTILIFGILSIVSLGPILGIPAWIMGLKDLEKIDQGKIPASERQLTRAGMILGIIGTFYVILVLLIVLPIVLVFVAR